MTDIGQYAARAAFRCQGYWLLSRLFLEPPTRAFLTELREALASAEGDSPEVQAEIAFLREAVREALQDPEAAAVEFTRRLVAIPKDSGDALPMESTFLGNREGGAPAGPLLQRLHTWGYGPALASSVSPDHLGAELRLMAWLCNDEREAWQRDDREFAAECLRRQAELMFGHIVRWIPDYCRMLADRTDNRYLHGLARMTTTTLGAEVDQLHEICCSLDIAFPR